MSTCPTNAVIDLGHSNTVLMLSASFKIQALNKIIGSFVLRLVTPENFQNWLDFEIAAYSSLVDGNIFLTFYSGDFMCCGTHFPQIDIVQNFKIV